MAGCIGRGARAARGRRRRSWGARARIAGRCSVSPAARWRSTCLPTSGIIPVLAVSEKLVGPSRLLFALVDGQNRPIANDAPEVEIGANGTIAGSFEAVVGEQELADAIRAVAR
jgi:hypothetical protein